MLDSLSNISFATPSNTLNGIPQDKSDLLAAMEKLQVMAKTQGQVQAAQAQAQAAQAQAQAEAMTRLEAKVNENKAETKNGLEKIIVRLVDLEKNPVVVMTELVKAVSFLKDAVEMFTKKGARRCKHWISNGPRALWLATRFFLTNTCHRLYVWIPSRSCRPKDPSS